MTRFVLGPVLGLGLLCLAACPTASNSTTDTASATEVRERPGLGESGLLVRELRFEKLELTDGGSQTWTVPLKE